MEYMNGMREIRFFMYFTDPQELTLKDLESSDKRTREYIEECEELIEQMKKYRLELAARSRKLLTMNHHIKISLIRKKRWKEKVYYYLKKEEVYDDGTTETISNEKYAGIKRHEAIKAFENCKKQFPQYEYYKDIARGRWE